MLLRDLQYFCAVAQAGNIARAAESLGVSQPTISKSVSRMERQMRVRLLERLPRGVRLSPAGTAFLRYANGANNLLRDAASEMREYRKHEAGVVRMGVGVGIAEPLVEDAIEALSARYKGLRYELRGGMSDTLLDSLEAGRIDIVVTGMAPQTRTGLRWEVLMSDALVFAAPRQHSLVRCKSISIHQLAASRLILPAHGTVTRAWVDALFVSEGLQPPLPFIESHASAREMPLAVRFDCVVLLPEAVFRSPNISRQLRRLAVPAEWDVKRPISVVTRIGKLGEHQTALVAALRR